MDANQIAAWQEPNPQTFVALEIALPNATYRLSSGVEVTFGGNTYGRDDELGFLSYVGNISSGSKGTTELPEIGLEIPTQTGLGYIATAAAQGSAWTLYAGTVDEASGLVDGSPIVLSTGFLNRVTIDSRPGGSSVSIESYSQEQLTLLDDAQVRLSDAFHKQVWPGETGLSNVSRVARDIYWRAKEPPRGVTRGGGGGGGGGGGVGGGGPIASLV